mmetsp:Transcript_3727/g.13444  ORF Transcript_3727/g.13444 Transcript_3727/m.13444 type:complete len:278 (+) Transcript_3727:953-1786(+)
MSSSCDPARSNATRSGIITRVLDVLDVLTRPVSSSSFVFHIRPRLFLGFDFVVPRAAAATFATRSRRSALFRYSSRVIGIAHTRSRSSHARSPSTGTWLTPSMRSTSNTNRFPRLRSRVSARSARLIARITRPCAFATCPRALHAIVNARPVRTTDSMRSRASEATNPSGARAARRALVSATCNALSRFFSPLSSFVALGARDWDDNVDVVRPVLHLHTSSCAWSSTSSSSLELELASSVVTTTPFAKSLASAFEDDEDEDEHTLHVSSSASAANIR